MESSIKETQMYSIEFQTKIENGKIAIPSQHQQEFADGNAVKVIILKASPSKLPRLQKSILPELMEHLISVLGDRQITRDEIYERES
jgi:DNA-directed RNA polymerase alpha subunit